MNAKSIFGFNVVGF